MRFWDTVPSAGPYANKSSRLDAGERKNYRPVSNLSFISKLTERAVSTQIVSHLNDNGMMPRLQSAYRRHHSTETALVKVLSDIYAGVDEQQVTLLGLLDLSAAFDCVDRDVLLQRLRTKFGITGTVLSWITSFLQDRTQQVFYKRCLSEVLQLLFGVPQGSVLGPLLFLLYVSELFDIVSEFGFTSHAYADDTQLYSLSVYQQPRARKQLNASPAALNVSAIGWPILTQFFERHFLHCFHRLTTLIIHHPLTLSFQAKKPSFYTNPSHRSLPFLLQPSVWSSELTVQNRTN